MHLIGLNHLTGRRCFPAWVQLSLSDPKHLSDHSALDRELNTVGTAGPAAAAVAAAVAAAAAETSAAAVAAGTPRGARCEAADLSKAVAHTAAAGTAAAAAGTAVRNAAAGAAGTPRGARFGAADLRMAFAHTAAVGAGLYMLPVGMTLARRAPGRAADDATARAAGPRTAFARTRAARSAAARRQRIQWTTVAVSPKTAPLAPEVVALLERRKLVVVMKLHHKMVPPPESDAPPDTEHLLGLLEDFLETTLQEHHGNNQAPALHQSDNNSQPNDCIRGWHCRPACSPIAAPFLLGNLPWKEDLLVGCRALLGEEQGCASHSQFVAAAHITHS